MPGIIVAAKVWRWTPIERDPGISGGYMQIGGLAPSFKGVRLNPYTNGVTGTARDGRMLKGRAAAFRTPIGRGTTNTGGETTSEGAFCLVDTAANVIANTTKWNQPWGTFTERAPNMRFVEWEWPSLVKADGIWLSTANDDSGSPGRRPVSWNLDAFLPGRGWYRVYSARKITPPTTDLTWYGPFEFRQIKPVSGVLSF